MRVVGQIAFPPLFFSHVATNADHAYWLSGIGLRDSSGSSPLGTIDVKSHGFGVGDPTPASTAFGGGALTGGQIPAIAYNSQKKTWGSTPGAPAADTLDVKATNIGAVTVGVQRARVDCNVRLNVQSDGPLRVTLGDGCNKTLLFPRIRRNTIRFRAR